jgi:SAM-dependent methyltransferase
MSKEFWNDRFSTEEYIYGTEPNEFFKEQVSSIKPGKILLPAEGEGRNAVYAASLGWSVDAVDFSEVAKQKALKLAESKSVHINYFISDLSEFYYPLNHYDVIGIFFLHLPSEIRLNVHSKFVTSLKSGGRIILEVFNKNQINNTSGGPKDLDLLYDEQDILDSFQRLDNLLLESLTINLNEGNHHQGKADVIRYVGIKK